MYLKELNLFGFKSFPEKISLKFDSGITAVVGPNGCGKSNIFDAIKWALGEQSPKSLRGAKMEDIIFNGTENHPALNYAEVSLNFSNEDKYLPINYNEVLISRRLYRSGESQYFINKSPVRLKDIQNLFLGTGIGESTYSFVEQGKIEALLSYKPEDKRLIFDEASGIVKYKERKKETLRRLGEADDNIVRLDDILAEVERQIRYLDRQAAKAENYKKTREELIEIEKSIAAKKGKKLDSEIEVLTSELELQNKEEKEISNQLSEFNADLSRTNNEQDSFRLELDQLNTLTISAQAQIRTHESNIDFSLQRIKDLEERSRQIVLSEQNLGQKLKVQLQRQDEEAARWEVIEKESKKIEEELEKLSLKKEETLRQIKQAQKEEKEAKEKILNLEGQKAQVNNLGVELQAQISTLVSRKKRLVLDKGKLDNLLSENLEKFEKAEANYSDVLSKLTQLQEKKQSLAFKEKALTAEIENLQSELSAQEREHLELNASFQFLKDFRIKYETFSRRENITVIFDQDPGNINKLVASLKNTELIRDGNIFKAKVEAKVIAFEENQLAEKINGLKTKISETERRIQGLQEEKQSLGGRLSSEDSLIERYKNSLNQAKQDKDSAERELKRLKEEHELVEEETKSTLSEIENLQRQKEETEKDLEEKTKELAGTNQFLFSLQENSESMEQVVREADLQSAQIKAQKDSLFKEKESINSKVEFFKEEIESIKANIEQLQKERDSSHNQSSLLREKIKSLQEKIAEGNQKIQDSLTKREELREKEADLNKKVSGQRRQLEDLEQKLSGLKQSIYDQKLKIQSLEYEKEKVKDYLKQVYSLDIELALLEQPEEPEKELIAVKEKLQKKLNSLGEVNLVAIEELQELKERRDFLQGQRTDLVDSKENLKKAINKINRVSRQIFLETFESIEKEFKKNYKFLFGGGRARLILLDPQDILESGVEIEVQPPGKKLTNVSLLSGGEKALTAIALIFSIFTVKPSPLCVLDEIDAPLDDANVDRFNYMLGDFSRTAQFILITHNKKTMSNADVLYGVTMQQKGVSKLVSVKFAEENHKTIEDSQKFPS